MKEKWDSADYSNRPPAPIGGAGEPVPTQADHVVTPVAQGERASSSAQEASNASMPPSQERKVTLPTPEGSGAANDYPHTSTTPPTPQDETAKPPHKNGIWKILAVLGAGFLTVQAVMMIVALIGVTTTLSTCMSSCSDDPIGDSRETAAFIADHAANDRDLETFDALRGCFDSLHKELETYGDSGMGSSSRLLSVDELRSMVASGSWPTEDDGGSRSPQVWVRIAELSEDYLEQETGESWQIVDFSYPFPNNGPIPVPATRGEDSYTSTRLLCTQGADEGQYVHVRYYRWRAPATFEDDLADQRAYYQERKEAFDALSNSGLLGTRKWLLNDDDVYVWKQYGEDALADPEAFLSTARDLLPYLDDYSRLVLLEPDTPINIRYDSMSSEYSNTEYIESVPIDEASERLLVGDRALYFDYAKGDVLLYAKRNPNEELSLESLGGTLAPTQEEDYRHPWRAPSEECVFDDSLAGVAAAQLGVPEDRIIVASYFDTTDTWYDTFRAWVIVPRGALPEQPHEFCTAMDDLRDVLWEQVPWNPERRSSMYVHVFEIDEQKTVDAAGMPVSFAELRVQAQQDPSSLDAYTAETLLSYMISATKWEDDPNRHDNDCRSNDVGGSIAYSRSWRYESLDDES